MKGCAMFIYLQLVSGANQFGIFLFQFGLQVFPIVSVFGIIFLVVECAHYVDDGEPPFVGFFVPNGAHLAVVIESYGNLVGHGIVKIGPKDSEKPWIVFMILEKCPYSVISKFFRNFAPKLKTTNLFL